MEEKIIRLKFDFVIVGGGLSGICAALAAARQGCKTLLIHDRPVLGGNASSEMRMHICGADNHMTRENARETGILEEILLENKRRNPHMVYPIFDMVLWEKVNFQENLTTLLNCYMTEVATEKDKITYVRAVQLTTEKEFRIEAEMFMDATGDGTLGAKAGALYAIGREASSVYDESLAPEQGDRCVMGNSLMFSARDMGEPVSFQTPTWAKHYTEEQLEHRDHEEVHSGYWWNELGGTDYDTTQDAELIKDELLKSLVGIWDHIKNTGEHDAEQLELDWVGFLPAKRESRRLLGDYVLRQKDIEDGKVFFDAVAYGGWSMDLHTAGGIGNEAEVPTVWNKVENIYTIPYRSLYSKNIENLFLGGRAISCSHVAFSSTRVMATCAVTGQAVGTAAAYACNHKCSPREVGASIKEIQQQLIKDDCYIPSYQNEDETDLARGAEVTANRNEENALPQNVINGSTRMTQTNANCWRARIKGEEYPKITLKLPKKAAISMIQLTFDSNLSREITPSIDRRVLARQAVCEPPELIKQFRVTLCLAGTVCGQFLYENKGQRRKVIEYEKQGILADAIEIEVMDTFGSDYATIFEVRAYHK